MPLAVRAKCRWLAVPHHFTLFHKPEVFIIESRMCLWIWNDLQKYIGFLAFDYYNPKSKLHSKVRTANARFRNCTIGKLGIFSSTLPSAYPFLFTIPRNDWVLSIWSVMHLYIWNSVLQRASWWTSFLSKGRVSFLQLSHCVISMCTLNPLP